MICGYWLGTYYIIPIVWNLNKSLKTHVRIYSKDNSEVTL